MSMTALEPPNGQSRRRVGRLAASLTALMLAGAAAACDNVVARVEGGSETGVGDAEVGLTF